MQYHEETRQVAEEAKTFVSPMLVPYICARRKPKVAAKKRTYSDQSLSLMSRIVGAGLFVVSILGVIVLAGPK
ncbi:MAG: hypothetical protein K1X67_17445 [Fimbriimonadaceae bacterium]|nr:hypothetical protein [Fimbriimonadaceae bacterium]